MCSIAPKDARSLIRICSGSYGETTVPHSGWPSAMMSRHVRKVGAEQFLPKSVYIVFVEHRFRTKTETTFT